MANYISSKLFFLSVTLIGIMYQVYVVDGLKCVVCLPKTSAVDPVATSFRKEINERYQNVRICEDNFEFKAAILVDQTYWRDCSTDSPWCYKYSSGNWSARTCRSGRTYAHGCKEVSNSQDCYCNNKDKCNSATGLHSTIINVIYAIISAFALNKFI